MHKFKNKEIFDEVLSKIKQITKYTFNRHFFENSYNKWNPSIQYKIKTFT